MSIIGITGNISSGKDTVAKMIQYYFACKNNPELGRYTNILDILESNYSGNDWQIKKFAAKLKQIASILTGCKVEDLESQEFKDSELPDEFQMPHQLCNLESSKKYTYRWLLQKLGTEAIRDNIHKDVWINSLLVDYHCKDYDGTLECDERYCILPNWIISDVRFLNESKSIKDRNGMILKIERGQSNISHSLETELNKIVPDYIISNNSTIEDLYKNVCKVISIIEKIEII